MSAPFTTPTLRHARVRPARAGKVDLVMPNPSGGKGDYVLDLKSSGEALSLSMHDRLLIERLVELPSIAPDSIRAAARELAAEGAAGRPARNAAVEAEAADSSFCLLVEFALVNRILRAAGLSEIDWRRLGGDDQAFRSELRGRLHRVAPGIGTTTDELFATLKAISHASAHLGLPELNHPCRDDVNMNRLTTLAGSLRAWAEGPGDAEALARLLATSAERTLTQARQAREAAQEMLADIVRTLRAWQAKPAPISDRLAVTDWLLDGWQPVCLLWEGAARDDRAAQRAVLEEIQPLVPFLDRSEGNDAGGGGGNDWMLERTRRVRLGEDWRTGLGRLDETARSEALRAQAA